ncbi:MAG: hypothetical protein R3C27_02195 [Hyphomonadaceae bacterium]
MSEDDFEGWHALTELIGDKCQSVGDDLRHQHEASRDRLSAASATPSLIKVNQIGTLTETL